LKPQIAMPKSANNIFEYRIYYEDTDAGGVVYYANYLNFFERARTDFLRSKNIVQSDLVKTSGLVFVVRNCQVEYLKPARMDDLIKVSVEIVKIEKLSITIRQEIKIHDRALCSMAVQIVCVDSGNFRPKKIPAEIIENLSSK
jgi:acyl-CoA thioester hydrolase